jgi:hypothetical protein
VSSAKSWTGVADCSVLAVDDGETAAIIMSLRQKLKAQTDEVVKLQSKLASLTAEHKQEVSL